MKRKVKRRKSVAKKVQPIPAGYTAVTPYLAVRGAAAAGATVVRPVANQFYGDRTCLVEDPFGHRWYIATHTLDLSKAELRKRAAAMAAAGGG